MYTLDRGRSLEMSARKKKTILRTIRLSEDIDDLLEEDAQDQNISANALISKIMTRYVEWDRITERINYVSISNLFFRALINEISDEKIEEIARNLVTKTIKNIAMLETGKSDFDALVKTFLLVSKYGFNVHTNMPLSADTKVEGQFMITLAHNWGPKGGIFFRNYFDAFIRNELGKQPTINVGNDVVTVSLPRLQNRMFSH